MAHPIVLAHGIARFDIAINSGLGVDQDREDGRHYFKRILSTLHQHGFHQVFHSSVDFAASLETRAETLWANVEEVRHQTGSKQVNIIAHSMGGLDTRRMMFAQREHGGYAAVASLSTIGTPHLGTSFADKGLADGAWALPLLQILGIDVTGVRDLTRQACRDFNLLTRAAEVDAVRNGLLIQTYAGVQSRDKVFLPLKAPWQVIHDTENDESDGLVSLSSARWNPDYFDKPVFVKQIDADHFNECGWTKPGEGLWSWFRSLLGTPSVMEERMRAFYLEIAQGLRNRGLA